MDQFIEVEIKGNPSIQGTENIHVPMLKMTYNFEEECDAKNYNLCLYAVADPDDMLPTDFSSKIMKFDEVYKMLQIMHRAGSQGKILTSYLDGLCFHDLLEKLNLTLEDMTAVFAIDPKKKVFYVFKRKFE